MNHTPAMDDTPDHAAPPARRTIPINPAPRAASACASSDEAFALMVLGESMLPEFAEGDIVIAEPDGLLRDGSYVIARHDDDWVLRMLRQHQGSWWLHAHDPRIADQPCADPADIRAVVIQKRSAGRRRNSKSYV